MALDLFEPCPTKVAIRHRTRSEPNPYYYIEVCADAVPTHAAHGDLVCCPNLQVIDPETCACVCPVAAIACPQGEILDEATCACQATDCAGIGVAGDHLGNPACTTAEHPFCCGVTGQCVDRDAIRFDAVCCKGTGCEPGENCCDHTCRTPEFFLSDPNSCGGCAVAACGVCAPGEQEEQRFEFQCGARIDYDGPGQYESEACCNGACAYLSDDPAHCGACGNACRPGEQCINGGASPRDLAR